MISSIPIVDLALFTKGSEDEKKKFVSDLGKAFHEVGFVSVKNHGIPQELVDAFYENAHKFFKMETSVKQQYEVPNLAGQRGFTSFGKEHAKQSNVGDLKEFFQIGQEVPDNHPLKSDYPNNVTTDIIPAFTNLGKDLYRAFEASGTHLLEAIAIHLELPNNYFVDHITHGNSILRAIHYPPITEAPASAIRAEQHEDINLITLLVGASADGLQVMNTDGAWVNAKADADAIVVNVGDMLQRLTNNYLRSTTHRVVNPPKEEWHKERLSIPFFLHPKADMDLTCLPKCISKSNPIAFESITAGEYLDERLREIGLKK